MTDPCSTSTATAGQSDTLTYHKLMEGVAQLDRLKGRPPNIKFSPFALEPKEVKKTWKERLFSWKPWIKTKTIRVPCCYEIDKNRLFGAKQNLIVCHESFREKFEGITTRREV